ncbi:hypothetical protein [Nitrobacter sp. TKz-YC02]|uniref:hypothetical protein n=1 Tax=Nitrobacter sp. TKz-YC02 TaxID=3398704 RepID=UPI003CF3F1DC
MTEAELKQEARLIAIEQLLANLFAIVYRIAGASDQDVEESHRTLLEKELWATVEGATPEQSDMLSAEIHDALSRILSEISQLRRLAKAQPE